MDYGKEHGQLQDLSSPILSKVQEAFTYMNRCLADEANAEFSGFGSLQGQSWRRCRHAFSTSVRLLQPRPEVSAADCNLICRSEAIHHVRCLGQAQLATGIVVQGEQLQAVLPFCRLSACSGTVAQMVCPTFDLPRFLTNTSLVLIIRKSLSQFHHQQAHSFAASWRALPRWPPHHNYSMLPCSGAGPADTFRHSTCIFIDGPCAPVITNVSVAARCS